jgi:hypothetical protein
VYTILNGFYFATRFAKKTDNYHQDYDAYYRQSRDHINYLNFYTPITKPNRDQSNLCLVPFDVLQERAPAVHDHLKGGGANFVHQRRKRLIVENADTRSRTYFDVDFQLEDLATAPLLSEGDLLIFRGDVLHKSQDLESTRVAASIRAGSSEYGYRRHTELRWFREGRKSSGEPPR